MKYISKFDSLKKKIIRRQKTIRLEWLKIPPRGELTGDAVLTEYMEGEPDYIEFHKNIYDAVYFKNYINNDRSDWQQNGNQDE